MLVCLSLVMTMQHPSMFGQSVTVTKSLMFVDSNIVTLDLSDERDDADVDTFSIVICMACVEESEGGLLGAVLLCLLFGGLA